MKRFQLFSESRRHKTFFTRTRMAFISVIVGLIASQLLAACSGVPGDTSASLGQEFILKPGQSASIPGEALKIRFLQILNDSRCPAGVTCIWAGEVSSLVEITYLDSPNRMVLTQPGSGPAKSAFNGYDIAFDVQPYPEAGKQIPDRDYRLQLTIDKKMALSGGILVTFQVIDETYSIFITNTKTIDQVFAVQKGESRATIPSGRIVRGSVPYNQPWSWHIDPEEVAMAEFTIELCDGKPSHVEADLNYWVDTVRSFCPWSARIVKIEDFR